MPLAAVVVVATVLAPCALAHFEILQPEAQNVCNRDQRWPITSVAGSGTVHLLYAQRLVLLMPSFYAVICHCNSLCSFLLPFRCEGHESAR